MRKWLARIRGTLGMGLTWATGWLGVGVTLWLGFTIGGLPVELLEFVVLFSVTGLAGGAVFAGVLSIAERKRQLRELSLSRFAGWGALAGFGASLSWLPLVGGTAGLMYIGVLTMLGAGSAAGALALARRADRDLMAGDPVAAIKGS